jgi:carboxymethylenebutenolidase
MPAQTIDLLLTNATTTAYLVTPQVNANAPGVLVLHAWWGLIPFFERLCDRLAEAGFVALAPDLYFGKTAGTIDEAQALRPLMEQGGVSKMMQAAVIASAKALRERTGKPIGVIGFSMGAAWATDLAAQLAPDDVRACVLFYGVYAGYGDFSQSRADFMGHFAANDEWEPDEGVRQTEDGLRKAGREVTFYRYDGAGHWFFEDDKPQYYNAEAAAMAWDRTIAFLRSALLLPAGSHSTPAAAC